MKLVVLTGRYGKGGIVENPKLRFIFVKHFFSIQLFSVSIQLQHPITQLTYYTLPEKKTSNTSPDTPPAPQPRTV